MIKLKKYVSIFYLIIFFSGYSYSFEIKPIALNNDKWLEDSIKLEVNDYSENCDGNWYKLFRTLPVHESITKRATLAFCKSQDYKDSVRIKEGHIRFNIFENECLLENDESGLGNGDLSSNDPILSGAFYNDDPTGRLRREESGFLGKLIDYLKATALGEQIETDGTSANKSHNGVNQFLHSMRSNDEKINETRDRIIAYIASNYNLARYIDEKLRSPNSYSIVELRKFLNEKIGPNSVYKLISSDNSIDSELGCPKDPRWDQLFYCGGSFEWGEDSKEYFESQTLDQQTRSKARALALLALGSALHVIQDSYSSSHVKRDTSGLIELFYRYSNGENIPKLEDSEPTYPKHCQHDSSVQHNSQQISLATNKSAEFLMQIIPSKTNAYSEKSCYEEMTNWLRQSVFKLTGETMNNPPESLPRLDTCRPHSPSNM